MKSYGLFVCLFACLFVSLFCLIRSQEVILKVGYQVMYKDVSNLKFSVNFIIKGKGRMDIVFSLSLWKFFFSFPIRLQVKSQFPLMCPIVNQMKVFVHFFGQYWISMLKKYREVSWRILSPSIKSFTQIRRRNMFKIELWDTPSLKFFHRENSPCRTIFVSYYWASYVKPVVSYQISDCVLIWKLNQSELVLENKGMHEEVIKVLRKKGNKVQ